MSWENIQQIKATSWNTNNIQNVEPLQRNINCGCMMDCEHWVQHGNCLPPTIYIEAFAILQVTWGLSLVCCNTYKIRHCSQLLIKSYHQLQENVNADQTTKMQFSSFVMILQNRHHKTIKLFCTGLLENILYELIIYAFRNCLKMKNGFHLHPKSLQHLKFPNTFRQCFKKIIW